MISISHMCNSHVMYGSVVTPPPPPHGWLWGAEAQRDRRTKLRPRSQSVDRVGIQTRQSEILVWQCKQTLNVHCVCLPVVKLWLYSSHSLK